MKITTFFTEDNVPKTGLTPTLSVWELDGTQVVTDQAMTEIGGGFYYYDYSAATETDDYVIRADGGVALPINERYKVNSNEISQVKDDINNILKVEKGNWEMKNNQMIFYDTDGTTELYKFNLYDNHSIPSMRNVFKRELV